jgi:flagellar M-ring protein FliF
MAAAITTTNPLASRAPAAGVASLLPRLKGFWTSRSNAQKIYLGAALAVTLGTIAFFVHMMMAPNFKPLMSGMEPADAQTLTSQLEAKKIPFQVSPDGTAVSVPADQVDAARVEVASHDAPHSGRIGFEIFDKISWGETEFDEKVNYQRALEGELERTIQTMSNIKSARVHLVMANDSVFTDRDRPAKASVTLRLKRGSISKEEVAAIGRLVAGAVDDLKPEDVALVDADSNRSLTTTDTGSQAQSDLEQDLGRRIVATLAPLVGADAVHATVNVEYDNSSSEENQDKYDPAVSVPLTVQKTEEIATNGAGAAGGVPGTSSNLPGAKTPAAPAAADAGPGQSSKTESASYGVNRTTRHVLQPAGRLKRMTAAVLVDDIIDRKQDAKGKVTEVRRKRSFDEMKLMTELAQAAIGYDTTRGDVVSVQNLSFHEAQELEPAPLTFIEKTQKGLRDYSSLVRYGSMVLALLLVLMVVVRPLQKRALEPMAVAAQELALTSGQPMDPPVEPRDDIAVHSLALKKQLADYVRQEPESSAMAVRAWLREGSA